MCVWLPQGDKGIMSVRLRVSSAPETQTQVTLGQTHELNLQTRTLKTLFFTGSHQYNQMQQETVNSETFIRL